MLRAKIGFMVILLALLASSCAGGGSRTNALPSPYKPLDDSSNRPFPTAQTDRSVFEAGVHQNRALGGEFLSASSALQGFEGMPNMHVTPAGQTQWAQYALLLDQPGHYVWLHVNENTEVSSAGAGPVLMLANFKTSRWEAIEEGSDLEAKHYLLDSYADYLSPLGLVYCTLVFPPGTEFSYSSVAIYSDASSLPITVFQASYRSEENVVELEWQPLDVYFSEPAKAADSFRIYRANSIVSDFPVRPWTGSDEPSEIYLLAEVSGQTDSYIDSDPLLLDQSGSLDYQYCITWVKDGVEGPCSDIKIGAAGSFPVLVFDATPMLGFGETVITLDTSKSYDPDGGEEHEIQFDLNDDGVIEMEGFDVWTFSADLQEDLVIRATVRDNEGWEAEELITVRAFENSSWIADDPNHADPDSWPSVLGDPGAWFLDLHYLILAQSTVGPYTIDVDYDFGQSFNDGVVGRVSLNAGIEAAEGLHSLLELPVPPAMPAGEYFVAIRVTDSTAPVDGGPKTGIFVWPNRMILK